MPPDDSTAAKSPAITSALAELRAHGVVTGGDARLAIDAEGAVRSDEPGRRSLARVRLAREAMMPSELQDVQTGLSVRFAMHGLSPAKPELASGFVVYSGARDGAALSYVVDADGVRDFLPLVEEPPSESVVYDVDVSEFAGLRLVENVLELLDGDGVPRLRISDAAVRDRNGTRREARIEVEGCAYDDNPAAPWERPPTHPGATQCRVVVSWIRAKRISGAL